MEWNNEMDKKSTAELAHLLRWSFGSVQTRCGILMCKLQGKAMPCVTARREMISKINEIKKNLLTA